MSLIDRFLPANRLPANRQFVRNAPNLQFLDSQLVSYPDRSQTYIDKAYSFNDCVYDCINLITEKSKVAGWSMYKIEDEGSYKQLRGMEHKSNFNTSDLIKIRNLRHKALKPVSENTKWNELLNQPNNTESFRKLLAAALSYKLITGNLYIFGTPLSMGVNKGIPFELQVLPSQFMDIFCSNTFPVRVNGYQLSISPDQKFTTDEILHEKMFNPQYDLQGAQLKGMSPMKPGMMLILKNNSLTSAEAKSFQNEGTKGIVSIQETTQAGGDDLHMHAKNLADSIRTEGEGTRNRGKISVSALPVRWDQIGLSNEAMETNLTQWSDVRRICNLFGGIPSQLLNDPENKVYSNMLEGEKALTTRCVLPHLIDFRDNLNRKGSTVWGMPRNQIADFDMTAFGELGTNQKDVAEWSSKVIALIPNEQREMLNLTTLDDDIFNEPWILDGTTRMPISEYNGNAVDNALNEIQ